VPTADEQRAAREVLTDLLAPTDNPTLAAAAAEASLGPLARARRLVEHGKTLLETLDSVVPENEAQDAREARQLQCEGLLREIDAAFSPETRPEDLTALRESLKARLAETPAVA
jgi:MoxR-like ATPase